MTKLVLLSVLFLFFGSCKTKVDKRFPKKDSFFVFKHVEEIVDSNTNKTIKYRLLDTPLTNSERDTLFTILKEFGWDYKNTTDGNILISEIAIQDLDGLYFLDTELGKRMKVSK